ncbi:restriction endonuclease subunit S [Vibrio crassostreae]|uniref:restriction endonuclease subunit S n=1 Tax=Vibrio crassostreae TaxID=246167 RepID=UPI0010433B4E|nr:restriction endonuclease subunit S [Vibrio crassostreae]TCT61577.1 type I restriction enzyme S subunit [Vibrio crassostreae]
MSELPRGWVETKLPNFAELIMGQSPASSDCNDVGAGIPFFQGKAEFQKLYPEIRKFCTKPKKTAQKEDILFSVRAPVGPTNLASEDCAIGRGLSAIRAYEQADRYLLQYFRSIEPWMSQQGTGSTFKAVSGQFLKELDIKVAPLAEQKRIVEKLDEVLAKVDTIKARLDSIPNLLKRFRQSVLASAVSGKLTEEWRELNKPSFTNEEFRDAITKYRYQAWLNEKQKKYEEKGKIPKSDAWKNKYVAPTFDGEHLETLPNGWIQDVLEGLVYISARIGWKGLKASEYTNEGPLFLSVHGLNHGTYVELSEAFHISEERYLESPEIMLKNDDILLCKDGAGIGKIAIVKGLDEKASINSSLLLIRAGDFFDTKFLYYLLSGPKMQSLVHDRMTGSAVPHLFQRDVKEFILDVPPLIEQKEIVRLVDQYFAFAETIEAQVKKAQAKVDNLTQSILAKAFRGELVPQDPNDEPADKLLDRIAKAREEAEALAKAAKKAEAAKKRAAKA